MTTKLKMTMLQAIDVVLAKQNQAKKIAHHTETSAEIGKPIDNLPNDTCPIGVGLFCLQTPKI